ncbi:hypothetical protein [Massilia sp. CF038]|uniref:hypothetical protein n=1 Tax=Massilia sp. CF038 TaxID=1881045 RepID=UPI000932B27C|nr:hypothetical protein [Massilia sp. CF038]
MNIPIPLFTAIFIAAVLSLQSTSLASEIDRPLTKTVASLIKKAGSGDHSAAEKLANITHGSAAAQIGDTQLAALAALLDSPSGAVRLWTAAALGNFGLRAAIHAPRLQHIVSSEACNMTGISAAATASVALEKMGMTPNPPGCRRKSNASAPGE